MIWLYQDLEALLSSFMAELASEIYIYRKNLNIINIAESVPKSLVK